MKKRALCGLLVLIMIVATACGGGSGAEEAGDANRTKDQVIVAMGPGSEPEAGFDPAYGWGAGEHVHEPLIQSTLTVTKTDLTIGYDLATAMTCSDDGLTWTVTIRDDVVFSDGQPLTAADVAFTYNTLKTSSSVNDFTMMREAVATGEYTVEFQMEHPYSIWPYTMAITGIIPEHAYGPDYGQNPIGSGRYKMVQWDKGQQVIFEANELYYGDEPELKKVTVVFMDEDAAFAAVKAGQVDIAYTASSYSGQTVDGYSLAAYESVDNRGFNLPAVKESMLPDGTIIGNDFTSDVTVRQAINMAVDRNVLIDHVLEGYGSPAYSVCDGMPWYSEENEVSCDPAKAAELLDQAGWNVGADGIRSKNGVRAELEILYISGDSVRQALAAEVGNQLKLLGIETSIRGTSWDTAYDEAQRQPLIWGWGAHTPMELYNIYHSVDVYGLAKYSPYANSQMDDLMDQALAVSDLEASYELWKEAQNHDDVPWIWLVNADHLYWVRNGLNVAEQKLHPHGHGWSLVNNVDQWTWN